MHDGPKCKCGHRLRSHPKDGEPLRPCGVRVIIGRGSFAPLVACPCQAFEGVPDDMNVLDMPVVQSPEVRILMSCPTTGCTGNIYLRADLKDADAMTNYYRCDKCTWTALWHNEIWGWRPSRDKALRQAGQKWPPLAAEGPTKAC